MIVALVVAVVVFLLVLRSRMKGKAETAKDLLVSREDRTANFARRPGRLRQKGWL